MSLIFYWLLIVTLPNVKEIELNDAAKTIFKVMPDASWVESEAVTGGVL